MFYKCANAAVFTRVTDMAMAPLSTTTAKSVAPKSCILKQNRFLYIMSENNVVHL